MGSKTMLSKPVLAKTNNRNIRAQLNDFCGDPEEWFDTTYFNDEGIYATSFDFFVNWETETICDEVWIKRISDSDQIYEQSEAQLLEMIAECDGREKSNRLFRFLLHQNMIEKYMLFRNVSEERWANGDEKVVEIDMSKYQHDSISKYDSSQIQEKINL